MMLHPAADTCGHKRWGLCAVPTRVLLQFTSAGGCHISAAPLWQQLHPTAPHPGRVLPAALLQSSGPNSASQFQYRMGPGRDQKSEP